MQPKVDNDAKPNDLVIDVVNSEAVKPTVINQ